MNFMAVDRTIVNDDGSDALVLRFEYGLLQSPQFFWYEDQASERLWLIPWDTDLAFHDSHITHIPGVWNDPEPNCTRPAGLGFSFHPIATH